MTLVHFVHQGDMQYTYDYLLRLQRDDSDFRIITTLDEEFTTFYPSRRSRKHDRHDL